MNRRALSAFAFLPLVACASAKEKEPAVEPGPQQMITYHASVASVPHGASNLLMRVRVPEEWRPLSVHGLVGNAPFEFGFEGDLAVVVPHPARPTTPPARLSWSSASEGGVQYRELVVETSARPVELTLRLAATSAAPVEATALEQELARGTSAKADGRPIDALATRLVRVR